MASPYDLNYDDLAVKAILGAVTGGFEGLQDRRLMRRQDDLRQEDAALNVLFRALGDPQLRGSALPQLNERLGLNLKPAEAAQPTLREVVMGNPRLLEKFGERMGIVPQAPQEPPFAEAVRAVMNNPDLSDTEKQLELFGIAATNKDIDFGDIQTFLETPGALEKQQVDIEGVKALTRQRDASAESSRAAVRKYNVEIARLNEKLNSREKPISEMSRNELIKTANDVGNLINKLSDKTELGVSIPKEGLDDQYRAALQLQQQIVAQLTGADTPPPPGGTGGQGEKGNNRTGDLRNKSFNELIQMLGEGQ